MSMIDIPNADASFLSVRRWQAGPEWRPRAHSHPFCEIIVVLRGSERVQVGGRSEICEPGHFLFYPPGCVHEERQCGDGLLEFLCLDFEWPHWPRDIANRIHDRQGRVQEITRWLVAEERGSYGRKGWYQDTGARMLAAEILRLHETPREDVLSQVHEYIHHHLDQAISLDDLAACVRVNKFHLARMFRARTGITPMEYIRQVRLDFAHCLLLESDLPLREIAPRAGFANEYHLSRLLKARYGRGAREIRRSKWAFKEPVDTRQS